MRIAVLGLLTVIASLAVVPPQAQTELRAPELVWGDLDRDGRDEALVLGPRGQVRLLANRGEGRLEDVTARSGLELAEFATCALIADFDGDGLNDLFLGSGEHRLWRNLGEGAFQPFSSGVEHDLIDLERVRSTTTAMASSICTCTPRRVTSSIAMSARVVSNVSSCLAPIILRH